MICPFPDRHHRTATDTLLPLMLRRRLEAARRGATATLLKLSDARRRRARSWSLTDQLAVEVLWRTGDVAIRHRPPPTARQLRDSSHRLAWPADIIITPSGRALLRAAGICDQD